MKCITEYLYIWVATKNGLWLNCIQRINRIPKNKKVEKKMIVTCPPVNILYVYIDGSYSSAIYL